MENKNLFKNSIAGISALSLLITGTSTFAATTNNQKTTTKKVVAKKTTPAKAVVASYKDGEYTANGFYRSPGGAENLSITITLKDNKIQEANVMGFADKKGSLYFQDKFDQGFKTLVIGKNINDIKLTVVNGSSLTPAGFMDALNKIKKQAKK